MNPLKDKLDSVNESIDAKRADAQAKWKAFEQHREEFAKAGNDATRTDSDEFKKAEQTHKEYSAVAEELKGLEDTREGIFAMIGDGPDAPQAKGDDQAPQVQADGKSLGARAAFSDEYKELLESGALNSNKRSFNAELSKSVHRGAEDAPHGRL